jgi:hypothetical protein
MARGVALNLTDTHSSIKVCAGRSPPAALPHGSPGHRLAKRPGLLPKASIDELGACYLPRRAAPPICKACRVRKEYRLGPPELVAKATASRSNDNEETFSTAMVDRRSWSCIRREGQRQAQACLRLFRREARLAIGGEATQPRRGTPDRRELCEASETAAEINSTSVCNALRVQANERPRGDCPAPGVAARAGAMPAAVRQCSPAAG